MSNLFLLWIALLHGHHLKVDRAAEFLSDIVTVAATEEPLYDGELGRMKTAMVMLEWFARESGGDKGATGSAGDCGRSQLLFAGARDGHSCEQIRQGGTLDLVLGLSWMRRMRDYCGGSVSQGLGAYASGKCDGQHPTVILRLGHISQVIASRGPMLVAQNP